MNTNPQEQVKVLRSELSRYHKYKDVIDHFLLTIYHDPFITSKYPTLTVFMFDKTNSILDEDKFTGSLVVDFRIQWLLNDEADEDGYGALANFEDTHYIQVHLYLYFKSTRPHIPATLAKFESISNKDNETLLSNVREFTLQMDSMVSDEIYLGHAIAYNDVM